MNQSLLVCRSQLLGRQLCRFDACRLPQNVTAQETDVDVFELDVATRSVVRRYQGVGTTLFNLSVHPTSGELWVANTEARNLVRFEPNLRGHLIDSRVTHIVPGPTPVVTAHSNSEPPTSVALVVRASACPDPEARTSR